MNNSLCVLRATIVVAGVVVATVPSLVHAARMEFELSFLESDVRITEDTRSGYSDVTLRAERKLTGDQWEGAPSLPAAYRTLVLPARTAVTNVTVIASDPVVIGEDLVPRPVPTTERDSEGEYQGDDDREDDYWYQQGQTFPTRPLLMSSTSQFRGISVGDLVLSPFEWRSDDQTLILYRSLEVLIDLGPPSSSVQRRRRDRPFARDLVDLHWLRERCANPERLDEYLREEDGFQGHLGQDAGMSVTERSPGTGFEPSEKPSTEGSPVDMVIVTGEEWADGTPTDGDLVAAWQELADWRTQSGTPTVVRTVQWIRANYPGHDDPDRVRNFVRDA